MKKRTEPKPPKSTKPRAFTDAGSTAPQTMAVDAQPRAGDVRAPRAIGITAPDTFAEYITGRKPTEIPR